ncbi:MAG: type I methionyl aminopeptidase [bacterium]|nr:type I methionyl aminopeptidase [bacterium]
MNKLEIKLKTTEEIERMAKGGKILRTVLEEVAGMVKPGITGIELDQTAEKKLLEKGAQPAFKNYSPSGEAVEAFPATLCVSVNSAVVHGIPNDQPLEEGDIVSLDIGCLYDGLYTDTAMTVGVGKISSASKSLIATTKQSLQAAIDVVKPNVTTGEIGASVQKVAEKAGYSVVREMVGHGVGFALHEAPNVPNYGRKGQGVSLPIGTVIAIEPMVNMGKKEIVTADDGWTVLTEDGKFSAHEEVTVAITKDGTRVLTTTK